MLAVVPKGAPWASAASDDYVAQQTCEYHNRIR
jgi:hypothetical protein